jgi:tRNA nucleotidyltransferase (CCA-adding enzyme)
MFNAKQLIQLLDEALAGWKTYVKSIPMLKAGVKVLEKINKKGFKAYIVGGTVRDLVLGLDAHDVDIATNMPMDAIKKSFKTYELGKSSDYGIVVVKEGGFAFELAQFRSDGSYTDGRRPDTVEIKGSFKDDAERRDFTINAMGIDKDGNILDYFNGRKDIKNKLLRTVGDPKKRFGDDKLRMMRAARFATKLDMKIDKGTRSVARKLAKDITKLSMERIRDELFKSAEMGSKKFAQYLRTLDDLKILQVILPEITALKYKPHTKQHHPEAPDVFGHVIKALEATDTKDPVQQLAILMHDVGKLVTQDIGKSSAHHTYYGHAEKGIELVDTIARRLKLKNKDREAILFAVGNHMRFHEIIGMRPSKVAKLVNSDNWEVLKIVAFADRAVRSRSESTDKEYEAILAKAIEIKDKYGINKVSKVSTLASGKRIIELTGLKPGKEIGRIKKATIDWIINNDIDNQKEVDDYILSQVKK